MCHGDVWSNNMFWKTNPDGSASDEVRAFFDLQLTFEGAFLDYYKNGFFNFRKSCA